MGSGYRTAVSKFTPEVQKYPFLRMRSTNVAENGRKSVFNTGRLFSQITLIIFIVEPPKANRGRGFEKCYRFSPPPHGSRDTAHAQWPRTHFQFGIIRTSWTNGRRVFKLGGRVDHVTRHVWQLFKKSKVKVTRSRDVSPDKNAVTRQWMVISTSNLVGCRNMADIQI